MAKKLGLCAFWAFVIFFIAFRPDAAATTVESIGDILATLAQGFGDFFTSLVS